MSDLLNELAVLPKCEDEVQLLYRDSDFLIINKPTRLLSVPGRHPLNRDSVIVRLQKEFPTAGIVHRLDFDTSGVMVIPRNKRALANISRQFQARTVKKSYTAVVAGVIERDGMIDLPIAADLDNRPKYKICFETGKKSVTEYAVITRDERARTTRVLLHPVTGRSHQLRLHLQAIGHPILGCEFYADDENKNRVNRLLLHATRLEFLHPLTGVPVVMQCDPSF